MSLKDVKKILMENSVGYANEPADMLAKRVIENSLNDYAFILADFLVDLEKNGVVLTSSDLLTALNSYFNMNVAEKILISILNAKTFIKTGVKF